MNEQSMNFEDDIVSVEENEVEIIDIGEESILSRAARFLMYGFILLFPVWFLPTAFEPVELNKGYFASVVLISAFMLALGGILQEGKARFLSSRLYFVYFLFAIASLLAALFSSSPLTSFWGIGVEPTTFTQIVLGGIALLTTTITLSNRDHIKKTFSLLLLSVIGVALFFLIQSVFSKDIFQWSFAKNRAFNPAGSWTTIAAFFGLGLVTSLPLLGGRKSWGTRVAGILFLLVSLTTILINVGQIWVAVGIVSLFFVALSLSQREQKSHIFALSLFILLAAVLFTLLGPALDRKLASSFDRLGRPQEATLSFSASTSIVRKSIAESPLFGSGLNTFGFLWDRFKDASVNNSIFWQVRFSASQSTFLTFLAEAGIVGGLSFILLFFLFLWQGIKALGHVSGEKSIFMRSAFAGTLYLFLLWFLVSLNQSLVLLTFVFLGLFLATCADTGVVRTRISSLFETKERGFVFSLLIIFLLVGSVGGIYYSTTRYLGVLSFGRSLEIFNTDGAVNSAESELRDQAIVLDATQDRYFRTYAQFEYVKIQRALNDASLDQKTRQERFQDAYQKAIGAARQAVELGQGDASNYRMLAQVYELAIPIDVNVGDLALENYEKARALSPSDPSLFVDMARTHLAVADVTLLRGGGSTSKQVASDRREKAIAFLNSAVKMKPDYTEAHFTLAQLYVAQGKLDEAIRSAEQTTQLVPNNVGVLFQLGLLYYRKENYDAARTVFKSAIANNPNYSNAKYFLGLIYDREGNSQEALKLFKEIADLNPGNEEVKKVIAALESGKKAIDALTEPPPEERKEAPLKEEKK